MCEIVVEVGMALATQAGRRTSELSAPVLLCSKRLPAK